MRDPCTPIRQALKRLEASDTYRKRKVRPQAMRPDGSEIARRKTSGARCPICDVPLRSWVGLVDHLLRRHGRFMKEAGNTMRRGRMVPRYMCACGFTGDRVRTAAHLRGQKDVGVHFAADVIKRAAEE